MDDYFSFFTFYVFSPPTDFHQDHNVATLFAMKSATISRNYCKASFTYNKHWNISIFAAYRPIGERCYDQEHTNSIFFPSFAMQIIVGRHRIRKEMGRDHNDPSSMEAIWLEGVILI